MSIQKQTTTAKRTQSVVVNLIDLTANLDDPRYHLAIGKLSIILEELNPHFASCDGLHIMNVGLNCFARTERDSTLAQFIVLKSLQRLFRYCRLDHFFGSRRLARFNPLSKTLTKHADRTEFHCSRKLVAATRTGALGFCAHCTNCFSAAIRDEKNTMRIPSSWELGHAAAGILLSCCTSIRVLRYTTVLDRVSEQNFFCEPPAMRPADNELGRCSASKMTDVNRLVSQTCVFQKQGRLASRRKFIHAKTSTPDGREARPQKSTADSTFPNWPPLTPYSKR
jgi:hypothetical protein